MRKLVDGAGVELSCAERGSGPSVLLVHGMAADASVWAEVVEPLSARARVIAYDRRGYGESGEPDPYERTTVAEQADDAAALVDALRAAPVIACGTDLGALVCLDLLKRRPALVAAAALVEPPLFAFVPSATEALSAERLALERALRERGPAAAVESWLGERPDGRRAAAARERPRAFFADYGALASWPVTRRELRAIGVPVVVLDDASSPAHVRAAGEALLDLVPRAAHKPKGDLPAVLLELVEGAGEARGGRR